MKGRSDAEVPPFRSPVSGAVRCLREQKPGRPGQPRSGRQHRYTNSLGEHNNRGSQFCDRRAPSWSWRARSWRTTNFVHHVDCCLNDFDDDHNGAHDDFFDHHDNERPNDFDLVNDFHDDDCAHDLDYDHDGADDDFLDHYDDNNFFHHIDDEHNHHDEHRTCRLNPLHRETPYSGSVSIRPASFYAAQPS